MNPSNFEAPKKASAYNLSCAGVFCSLVVLGCFQLIAAARNPDGLEYPKDLKSFREGLSTQILEKQLDQKMPMRTELIALANTLRYQMLNGSGDQVRIGKNGWLFLTEEIQYEGDQGKPPVNQPEESLRIRLDLIAAIAQRLNTQGVRLVVALVPDKARIYEQQMSGQAYPSYNTTRYSQVLTELANRQVVTVDLLSPLQLAALEKPVYYKTDTHWNQDGAKVSAMAIASAISKLGIELEKTQFKTTVAAQVQARSGDLIRLMGVEKAPESLRPILDREASAVTQEVQEVQVTGAGIGLFADSAVPVVLTGTSYSLRGNFHGYLQQAIGSKVLNTAKDGGGFVQALTAYLKDDSFKSSKPKILVWEIPERMFKSALTEEMGWLKSIEPAL